eukprot:1045046-Amphidinium_carterae.2
MAGTPWTEGAPTPWSSIWPPVRPPQGAVTSRPQNATAAVALSGNQGRTTLLDTPPSWSGAQPETQLNGYLKALEAWSLTTRLPAKQRGVAVLGQASGDLRQLIATLELDAHRGNGS